MKPTASPLFFAFWLVVQSAFSAEASVSADSGSEVDSPVEAAIGLFNAGRFDEAVARAKDLAEQGEPDALFLLGMAAESGRGLEASREAALDYYRQAAEKGSEDALYRRGQILLGSDNPEEVKMGRELLEKQAGSDKGEAANILAQAWLGGQLTGEADPTKAEEWWTRSDKSGNPGALILLGRLYGGDFGFPKVFDMAKAIQCFTTAAENGVKEAYLLAGGSLLHAEESLRDEKAGRMWLGKATEDGQLAGWLSLGNYEETIKKDLKSAYETYLTGANAGQVECMLRVATMNKEGRGVEADPKKAFDWLMKAAEAGSAKAHSKLAEIAMADDEAPQEIGYGHMVAAANGGDAVAQNQLGQYYFAGKFGGSPDMVAAEAWFRRAASAGLPAAHYNMASLYERGLVVSQDIGQAVKHYQQGFLGGDAPSTTALARLEYLGVISGKPNVVEAWALASLGKERGDQGATELLGEMTVKLTEREDFSELMDKGKKRLAEMKAPPVESGGAGEAVGDPE